MNLATRIILALGILVVDSLVFFVPLGSLFLAYIVLFNPFWFRDYLNDLETSRRSR
ncbi:MAG: hypothetical protein V1742_00955 [Pseudomonadota bacterium]